MKEGTGFREYFEKCKYSKKTIKKVIKWSMLVCVIIFILNVFIAMNRVDNYSSAKPSEEYAFTDKIAAFLKGYDIDTRKELEDKGIILSEEKKEAKVIADIFKETSDLLNSPDSDDTNGKMEKLEKISKKLHEENSSGKIKDENLISLINNCIEATDFYKFKLSAMSRIDAEEYKEYNDKFNASFRKINNDLDRLGFAVKK